VGEPPPARDRRVSPGGERVLREQLGDRRLRFTDSQCRRLATKGKALIRSPLEPLAGLVTPDTILRWLDSDRTRQAAIGPGVSGLRPSSFNAFRLDRHLVQAGLRSTSTDLVRRANVDAVVRRALTRHVTEAMQRHYSTAGLDEKRAAIAGVLRLAPPEPHAAGGSGGGNAAFPPEGRQRRSNGLN
jgi:hypothetical protein